MKDAYSRVASALLALLSTLLLVDLFLTWREVRIGTATVGITDEVSGWSGWGIVVGIATAALLVYALLELSGYIPPDPGTEIGPAAMGIVILLSTLARFDTVVHLGGPLGGVFVDRRWPATAGLVLAIAIVVVAVARLLLRGPAFGPRPAPLGR